MAEGSTDSVTGEKRKFSYPDTVTVLVGPEERRFIVHKEQLCESSDFFKNAFKKGFKEGKSKELKLPEEDSSNFESFVDWLFEKKINVDVHMKMISTKDLAHLVELYAMSDRLQISTFAIQIIDTLYSFIGCRTLINGYTKAPSISHLSKLYNYGLSDSGLYSLFLHWFSHHGERSLFSRPNFKEHLKQYPSIAIDLAEAYALRAGGPLEQCPQEVFAFQADLHRRKQ